MALVHFRQITELLFIGISMNRVFIPRNSSLSCIFRLIWRKCLLLSLKKILLWVRIILREKFVHTYKYIRWISKAPGWFIGLSIKDDLLEKRTTENCQPHGEQGNENPLIEIQNGLEKRMERRSVEESSFSC